MDLPIKNGDFPSFFVNVYQRATVFKKKLWPTIVVGGAISIPKSAPAPSVVFFAQDAPDVCGKMWEPGVCWSSQTPKTSSGPVES